MLFLLTDFIFYFQAVKVENPFKLTSKHSYWECDTHDTCRAKHIEADEVQ